MSVTALPTSSEERKSAYGIGLEKNFYRRLQMLSHAVGMNVDDFATLLVETQLKNPLLKVHIKQTPAPLATVRRDTRTMEQGGHDYEAVDLNLSSPNLDKLAELMKANAMGSIGEVAKNILYRFDEESQRAFGSTQRGAIR
jgi:hypothetical protein